MYILYISITLFPQLISTQLNACIYVHINICTVYNLLSIEIYTKYMHSYPYNYAFNKYSYIIDTHIIYIDMHTHTYIYRAIIIIYAEIYTRCTHGVYIYIIQISTHYIRYIIFITIHCVFLTHSSRWRSLQRNTTTSNAINPPSPLKSPCDQPLLDVTFHLSYAICISYCPDSLCIAP